MPTILEMAFYQKWLNLIFYFFQSLTHFQPYIEESLAASGGGGRDTRSRGHFHNQGEMPIPGMAPPPAKIFYDHSDSSTSTSEHISTFPRQRRVVETSSFLPPPPPPICDDFSSHVMSGKRDRRKTVTFLGDVETIPPPCDDNVTSSDFFPLPPPILPHSEHDAATSTTERQSCDDKSKKSCASTSTNSPDYVESSV